MAAPSPLPSLPGTSPVQLGWLLAKTLGNITPGLDLGSPGPIDFGSLLQAIDASNVLGAIEQAAADLATYVTDAIAHPSSFAQLSLATFIDAGRDLIAAVLGGLQDLLEALLDVGQQVLAGIAGISTTGSTFPASARSTSSSPGSSGIPRTSPWAICALCSSRCP